MVMSRFGIVGVVILLLGYCALTQLGGGGGGLLPSSPSTTSAPAGQSTLDRPKTANSSSECSDRPSSVWGEIFQQAGAQLHADHAGRLHARDADGLRHRPGGDGAVLLPERPEDLHRPRVLQRAVAALQAPGRLRRRPMSSPTRSATTSRTSKARSTRRSAPRHEHGPDRGQSRSRSGSSCRPTAMPACGRPMRAMRRARSSSPATSKKACAPPKRSATTCSRSKARASSCRKLHPRLLGAADAGAPDGPEDRQSGRLQVQQLEPDQHLPDVVAAEQAEEGVGHLLEPVDHRLAAT